jgi:hypothetical protein
VIRLLLNSGVNLAAADNTGRTAFDHAAEGGLTGFERLLCVPGRLELPPASDVTIAMAPALHGLRLGMSATEASARLGGLTPAPGRCGLSTLRVPSGHLPALTRGFEGVSFMSLVLLNGRVVYLNVAYSRELPFKSLANYLAMLSSSLRLPQAWRQAVRLPGVEWTHAMTCNGS